MWCLMYLSRDWSIYMFISVSFLNYLSHILLFMIILYFSMRSTVFIFVLVSIAAVPVAAMTWDILKPAVDSSTHSDSESFGNAEWKLMQVLCKTIHVLWPKRVGEERRRVQSRKEAEGAGTNECQSLNLPGFERYRMERRFQ